MIQAKFYTFTQNQFTNLYKDFSPNASQSTIKTFETALKRIEKVYNSKLENLKLKFINDPKEILKKFEKTDYSKNTQYSTINMINKLIIMIDAPLNLKKEWSNEVKRLTNERDDAQLDNMKTIKEDKNWIDYDDLLDLVHEEIDLFLESDFKNSEFRNLLIFCLYCLMPPARICNYLNCKVIRDNTDLSKLPSTHNYIIIKKLDTENPNFYFVFNKFKTSKKLGTQMFKVESIKLNSLLKLYFKNVNKDGDFFLMSKKKEITQPNLTNILKNTSYTITKKNLSCNMLRHIYISHFLSSNPTLREKLEIAGAMGQSYYCNQQDKYNRI